MAVEVNMMLLQHCKASHMHLYWIVLWFQIVYLVAIYYSLLARHHIIQSQQLMMNYLLAG